MVEAHNGGNAEEEEALQERIHWILLILGFVLADTGDREKPLICRPFLQYWMQNPQEALEILLNMPLQDLLKVLDSPRANSSPLVVETLFWVLERWCKTFLCFDPSDYYSMLPTFPSVAGDSAIGVSAAGAWNRLEPLVQWPREPLLKCLLEKLSFSFTHWQADADVLAQLIKFLAFLTNHGKQLRIFQLGFYYLSSGRLKVR